MNMWSAPGRVNLVGEHTDYNNGLAMPFAIPQRTRVRLEPRSDGGVTATTDSGRHAPTRFNVDTAPGDLGDWGAYVAGVFWALRSAGHEIAGADVQISSDVPRGAGLSSSAAIECAIAVALNDVHQLGLDATTLALLAQKAENDYVGAPTGALDQMASMHGRADHVVLFDAVAMTAEPVPCLLNEAGLTLLIVDTRAPHRHVDGEYGARRKTCEAAARVLGVNSLREVQGGNHNEVLARFEDDEVSRRRVRHVLTENARVVEVTDRLKAGKVRDIGALLTASHTSMRDDYEITVPEVDVAVDTLVDAGALGARMTGGGFGGSVIALLDDDLVARATTAVEDAFAKHDFRAPRPMTTVPSAGAGVGP